MAIMPLTLVYQTKAGADRVIGGRMVAIWHHMRKLCCEATVYDRDENIVGRVERTDAADDRRVKWLRWIECAGETLTHPKGAK